MQTDDIRFASIYVGRRAEGMIGAYDDWGNVVDLVEWEKQIRAEVIEEVKQKLNSKDIEITFDLPVEEILGEDIDLDDFAMLVQEAIQVYRKMVLGVLEQLKENK